jgi:hypothetical protein
MEVESFPIAFYNRLAGSVIFQGLQTWVSDKNYPDLKVNLDYETVEGGPGYAWVTTSDRDKAYRIQTDVELSVALKRFYGIYRSCEDMSAGWMDIMPWTGFTFTNENYRINGVPFMKVRLCDIFTQRPVSQIVVNI